MMKGIPQEKRNNAWHTKHTKKKAQARLSHAIRLARPINHKAHADGTAISFLDQVKSLSKGIFMKRKYA